MEMRWDETQNVKYGKYVLIKMMKCINQMDGSCHIDNV